MTDVLEPAPSEGVGSAWHPALKDFIAGRELSRLTVTSIVLSPEVPRRDLVVAPLTVRAESAMQWQQCYPAAALREFHGVWQHNASRKVRCLCRGHRRRSGGRGRPAAGHSPHPPAAGAHPPSSGKDGAQNRARRYYGMPCR